MKCNILLKKNFYPLKGIHLGCHQFDVNHVNVDNALFILHLVIQQPHSLPSAHVHSVAHLRLSKCDIKIIVHV